MSVALVIIDVQKAILEGKGTPARQSMMAAALDETVSRLSDLQRRARLAGVPVIVIQHDDPPGSSLAAGTPGWELRAEIAPLANDILVHKRACDSFFETDLAERLNERAIRRLVVGGCMTQFCVDTSVRRAVSLGYDVTLVADGHMTGDTGNLGFEQIIAHHNATLDGFDAGEHVVRLCPAHAIAF